MNCSGIWTEALTLQRRHRCTIELRRALAETERLTFGSADELAQLDMAAHGREVNGLLLRASELGATKFSHRKDFTRADLIGVNLKGADLKGANCERRISSRRPAGRRPENG